MRLVRFRTDMNSNLTRMRQGGVRTWLLLVAGAAANCNQEQEQRKRTCRDKISNYRHLSLFTFAENSIGRARTLFINLSECSENWPLLGLCHVLSNHSITLQICSTFSIWVNLPACGLMKTVRPESSHSEVCKVFLLQSVLWCLVNDRVE